MHYAIVPDQIRLSYLYTYVKLLSNFLTHEWWVIHNKLLIYRYIHA